MSDLLFVGVDAGGTKTAALAMAGDCSCRLEGPAAQALRDGPEAAAAVVAALLSDAQGQLGGVPFGGVAVGLAGAGRDSVRGAVSSALAPHLDGAPFTVTHDADIAYHAAWGDGSGALLLVGTGSLVFARTEDGETVRAGGWGTVLGDDGSGAALGRAALRVLLAALDGGPPSTLPEIAAERFDLTTADDVMAAVYTERRPLASFCPLLLAAVEAGDWTAEAALHAEVNGLAKQAGWLATRTGDGLRQRLAYAGGLSGEPVYRAALEAALDRHLPGWDVSRCEAEPVEGALAMARALAG
ncbi:BadF/BadG/BcrA/BcrD ATPase family protein [Rubrivirga marina]|uniref:BadF/BadG/BcrA/BcrD ATPase family protein n=1 Tax=Rubrivirga marina TaxID=1196024 RepID=UPI00117AC1B5|nr:BadF/BadG/BcrA/BcrD ATPase family protein [Rubrivirga marina]